MQADGCGACRVAGPNEEAGRGVWAQGFCHGASSNIAWCSQYPALSHTLYEQQGPNLPVWWLGDRVSLQLGLGGPQSPALGHQAPGDGPLLAHLGLGLAPRRPADLS